MILANFAVNPLVRQSVVLTPIGTKLKPHCPMPPAHLWCPELHPTGNFHRPGQGCERVFSDARGVSCHARKSGRADHGLIRPLSCNKYTKYTKYK